MEPIVAGRSTIHFNQSIYNTLNEYIKSKNFSKIFVLVDSNTHAHCLPIFLPQLATKLEIEIIEIEAGEQHKTINTCVGVWNTLSELDGDRKSLLLNLGGGVITDLGGFIASTFKRGIDYVNIPTSLLAMVDASVGGKTGVDLGHLKNQVGVVNLPDLVLIDTQYLNTLPANQMRSGLAEMLKHGLIKDVGYWNKFKDLKSLDLNDLDNLIYESVLIKKHIVEADPLEKGLRKTLNYGHTLGHAIESYFLSHPTKKELLHGEAIAIGMVMETYISKELYGFPDQQNNEIKAIIKNTFGHVDIEAEDLQPIIELLKYDKKNEHGNINFVLLESIGNPKIDCQVEEELILNAFKFYKS